MGRFDLSDDEYAFLRPLLPPEHSGKAGHPWADHRRVLNGIFWVLRTGSPWRDLPGRYGPFTTASERLCRWQREGLWSHLLELLQARARALGTIDFSFCALDATSVRAHRASAGAARGSRTRKASKSKPSGSLAGASARNCTFCARAGASPSPLS